MFRAICCTGNVICAGYCYVNVKGKQMFKLALRNMTSKPLRTVATVAAVAVAVAMIFAMLSFSPAVYEYIYSTQTAASGRSDIVISTNSSSDRIINVAKPLYDLMDKDDNGGGLIEYICPTLSLYAILDGEYVKLRGFERGGAEYLQDIDVLQGDKNYLDSNEDNVVVSKNMAERFGLQVGDDISLSLGNRLDRTFYVGAIADISGYFLDDSPFLVIGRIEGISGLISGISSDKICNEIYVKAKAGVDVDALLEEISEIAQYSSMLIKRTDDAGYIREQADSLSAPVVLAGFAVFALGIAVIVLLFMMSESEKISLISKYGIVGATKKQILGIFMTESVIIACFGALLGSALAVGVFVGILKLTLSPTIAFSISAVRLFGSALIGLFSAVASSLLPILRSFRGTIRQNQIDIKKRSRFAAVACPVMIVLTALSVAVEFAVPAATAVMSVVSLVLALSTLGICISSVLRITARVGAKMPRPSAKVASLNLRRDGRFARSVTMLGVGMTVSMMLFMAWAMTKSVFGDYVSNFSDMIFVTNVQSSVDTDKFLETEGVDYAAKIVWKQGALNNGDFDKTMNILGSKQALNLVDFGFVTDRARVEELLDKGYYASDADGAAIPYVFLDKALTVLYGAGVGDEMTLTLDGVSSKVVVGGILDHQLFSGNYIVMSEYAIESAFGVAPDTVVLKSSGGNISETVNRLRENFADNNYYVVDVLTAYRWDMQSTDAVFDLVGTLAIVVAVFIFAVSVTAGMVGRGVSDKSRTALLNAGMSKNSLLCSELLEHFAVAAVSFVLAFVASVLLTACLIHALRLFGLYFEFMYEAWVVALVGGVMCAAYSLVPIAFNFRKSYNLKKR